MPALPPEPPRFRRVAGEARLQGRRFESLRASLRRAGFRAIGGSEPSSRESIPVAAFARLRVDGLRALFLYREAGEAAPTALDPAGLAFARALARVAAGGDPLGAVLGNSARRRLDRTIDEAADPLGDLRLFVGIGAGGLSIGVGFEKPNDFEESEGATLALAFRGGPTLRARVDEGHAQFPAASALLDSREIECLALELGAFGSLVFEPRA